ncbi:MAG TPA: T9SS type A sorting domain-containing protein, partial [Chitinophagales bacterium]|nr:T9SS type A sorting domain-containing protein [Chitinophagales bacterium]
FYAVRYAQKQVAMQDSLSFIVDSSADSYRATGLMNTDGIHMNQKALNQIGANVAKSINFIEHHINMDSCYTVPPNPTQPDWEIYPSPFTDKLFLRINNCNCIDFEMRITDMLGRTVFKATHSSFTTDNSPFSIDVGGLTKGVYLVRVMLNKQWTLTKKVVKS